MYRRHRHAQGVRYPLRGGAFPDGQGSLEWRGFHFYKPSQLYNKTASLGKRRSGAVSQTIGVRSF